MSGSGEAADLHGYTTHGGTRPPLVRWDSGVLGCYCSHTTHVGSAEGMKFACRRCAPRFRERPNGKAPRHHVWCTSLLLKIIKRLRNFLALFVNT